MARNSSDYLGKELATLKQQVKQLQKGRLGNASMHGGALPYYDDEGNLRAIFGDQGDGSWGAGVVSSPSQPTPTAPLVVQVDKYGRASATWDGGVVSGQVPRVHGRVDALAAFSPDGSEPALSEYQVAGTIWEREGGTAPIVCPQPGTWFVRLQMVGADERTKGAMSDPSTVDIEGLVDTDALQAELGAANDRITEADGRLSAGQSELDGKLLDLDQRKAERSELDTGLADVYADSERRAQELADSAVSQAAANAQSEYDRLQGLADRALSRVGDNLIEDPSFESTLWDTRWAGTGGAAFRTSASSEAVRGQRVAVIDGSGTQFNTAYLTPDGTPASAFDVREGQVWRFAVNVGTGVATTGVALWLVRVNPDGTTDGSVPTTIPSGHSIGSRVVLDYTVPSGVTRIAPAFRARFTEGVARFDDVEFRDITLAREALLAAEAARERAEAAHAEAGNAADLAASAYDSASSKNTIHWSLSAPSGTGSDGDVWWRYTNPSGSSKRQVVQSWHWDAGIWQEDELSEEYLPLVNIGTGTYGQLEGDRFAARSVQAQHLAVGSFDNLIHDPDFNDLHDGVTWRGGTILAPGGSYGWHRTEEAGYGGALRLNAHQANPNGVTRVFYRGPGGNGIRVEPGEEFSLTVTAWRSTSGSATNRLIVRAQVLNAEGATLGWPEFFDVRQSDVHEYTGSITIPAGGKRIRLDIINGANNAQAAEWTGDVWIAAPRLRRKVGGVLISENGVKSPQIDTDEFFANQAVIDTIYNDITLSRLVQAVGIISETMIATGAITTPKLTVTEDMTAAIANFLTVNAGMLAANAVQAMHIEAGAIDGKTITGSTVQTSSTWATTGGAVMREDGTAGNFVAVDSAGQTVARLGGARNELANLSVDGDITARSVALEGELRVGGNGEGALVPDTGRLRIQGRMPRADASARDLLTTGTTNAMQFTASNWVDNGTAVRISHTINYPAPAPSGNRYPIVSLHGDTPNMEGPGTVTSRAQNPGQFQAVVRSAGPSGTHGDVRIRYLAVWADASA